MTDDAAPSPSPAPPAPPPLILAPLYLTGAPIPAGVRQAAAKAAPPALGALGLAVLAAVAGYYVPRLLDRFATPTLDPEHGEPVELEVEE